MSAMQAHRHLNIKTPLKDVDYDQVFVRRFRGRERLGRLFEYVVDLHTEELGVEFEKLLGENVTVSLDREDIEGEHDPRYFNGFVSHVEQTGWEGRRMVYRITLVPWLWFATLAVDCRVHAPRETKKMKMPDLVKTLIQERGLGEVEDKLRGTYREWDFSIQYNESYHDYFKRLMEREGFYSFYKHENGLHKLVLVDDPGEHEIFEGATDIEIRREGYGSDNLGYIRDWLISKSVRSGRFAVSDYNYMKPNDTLMVHREKEGAGAHANDLHDIYEYPGGFTTEGEGKQVAQVRIDGRQALYEIVRGHTNHRGLAVGNQFSTKCPPETAEQFAKDPTGKYLVIEAEYDITNADAESMTDSGRQGDFSCRFVAIPADTQFRLDRITPRPIVEGPQTAVVVGKSGDEVHSDELARVRVQFHWDRDGVFDENSSIWIRVSHAIAGKGWGHQYTPRVGQEVIVSFLEGDPDRPIVTGRVYNELNKPPYDQGKFPTISTMKSNSSKGGGGFNEVRFDDKKDEEQVFLHAQKNYDQRVLNDRFEWIGNDRHLIVKNDKHEHVENDRHEKVDRHHHEEIAKDRNKKVGGKEVISVTGMHSETVGGDVIEVYKKNQSTEVTDDLYIKADNICIEGMTNVTIKVGQSYIAIEKGGIKIGTTGNIAFEAKGNIEGKSTGNTSFEATAKGTFKSTGPMTVEGTAPATLKSSAIVTVQGSLVKIN